MNGLNRLEQAVLDKLLAGSDPVVGMLREQAKHGRLAARRSTGAGFFCEFEMSDGTPLLTNYPDFHFGDVNAAIKGLDHGAGFVLRVRSGRLSTLEGYSYDEAWPAEVTTFSLTYQSEPRALVFPRPRG